MSKGKAFITRLSAACAKLPGDFWRGRGAFSRLAHASRWRVLLVECAVLAIVCGGHYLLHHGDGGVRCRLELRAVSDELRAIVLELEAERRDLKTVEARRALLAGLVLDKEARAQLLSELTDPTAHPGLEIMSIRPQPSEGSERYVPSRSLISMEGGFDDFLRFLRRIESEATPCAVVAMDIHSVARARPAANRPTQDTVRISGAAVRLPDPEPVQATREEPCRERISVLIETYAEADASDQRPAPRRP